MLSLFSLRVYFQGLCASSLKEAGSADERGGAVFREGIKKKSSGLATSFMVLLGTQGQVWGQTVKYGI
jgi:hypothetical protein